MAQIQETTVLLDPASVPFVEMRSAVPKALLEPGELALSQNLRHDTGLPTTRGGTLAVFTLPVSVTGATVVDLWSGELNGTQYIVVAYALGGKYEIWASENGGTLARISEVGGLFGGTSGDTRFATQTGRVVFQPVKMPRYSIIGSPIPSKDVLIISNGTDDNLVWNPAGTQTTVAITGATNATPIRITTGANHNLNDGDTVVITGVGGNTAANGSYWVDKQSNTTFDLYSNEGLTTAVAGSGAYTSGGTVLVSQRLAVHKKVTVPQDWKMFSQTHTMRDYWTVAAAAATHTYLVSGVVNQSRWKFGDSSTAPYSGANTCLLATWTTSAAAGDVASFYMSGDQLNMNRAIGFLIEGDPADIDRFFSRAKMESGKENVAYGSVSTWSTIFDPSGTAEKQRKSELIIVNLANNRYMLVFPTDHIAVSNRTAYHLRFIYDGVAPTAGGTITILAVFGCGDMSGGSTWELSYEDAYGFSESFAFGPSMNVSAKFEDLGGPDSYTGGLREELLPIDSQVLYDFKLTVPQSQGADIITGGLNGEPSHVNFYLRLAEEAGSPARYFYSLKVYDPGSSSNSYAWSKISTGLLSYVHNTGDVTGAWAVDESDRDPFREAPGEWQHELPPFLASCYANSRLFVGNIYDTVNSRRQPGIVYFSGKSNPFRIQDTPIVRREVDESAGSRDDYAGETIMALVSCAAQSAGRSMVHVVASKSFNVQGYAGGLGSADEATALGTHTRISDNGTNAARCVAESNGRIIWPDQFGQHMEFYQGQMRNLSLRKVDDKFKAIPTGRLDDACAVIFKDRYYNPYSIAAGSTNARCLLRNLIMDVWESDDLPVVSMERVCVFYDSSQNGDGQRLLAAASTGVIYEYDKIGSDDLGSDIAVRLVFGEFLESLPGSKSLIIGGFWIAATAQSNTFTIDRYYRQQTGLSRSTCSLATGRAWDQGKPTVQSGFADGRGERGMAAYVDVYGNMDAGTSIEHMGCQTMKVSDDDAVPGN